MDVDALDAWCRGRKWPVNGKSRARFVLYLLRRKQKEDEGNGNEKVASSSASVTQDRTLEDHQKSSRPDIDLYAPCPCGSGKKTNDAVGISTGWSE